MKKIKKLYLKLYNFLQVAFIIFITLFLTILLIFKPIEITSKLMNEKNIIELMK